MLRLPMNSAGDESRTPFGIPGLDDVLYGGMPRHTLFFVEGQPGAGKTTLALQFVLEGVRRGETSLLVSNAESEAELHRVAASHGWELEGLRVMPWQDDGGEGADAAAQYTLFPAAEVEVEETLTNLFQRIDELRPARLVIDSIAILRLSARDPAFYRQQIQRLRDFLRSRSCTTLLVDDVDGAENNTRTRTLADGVLELEQRVVHYGGERRRIRVRKVRGSRYIDGSHDFAIRTGGIVVFPRLVAMQHDRVDGAEPARSGAAELDALAGGGLPRGTSTLIMGPAGCGKSTLASLYVQAAMERGERAAAFLFDESEVTWLQRSEGLGLAVRAGVEDGRVRLVHLDPAELSPGELAHRVVRQVDEEESRVVVIDTLNGYFHAAVEESTVLLHLRELLSYLSRRGVVTLMVLTQHGLLGTEMTTPMDVSFIADNVFLLRYFEAAGTVRQALSMVKKRTGPHERTIRELYLRRGAIGLSQPLAQFSGVLTGSPVLTGHRAIEIERT